VHRCHVHTGTVQVVEHASVTQCSSATVNVLSSAVPCLFFCLCGDTGYNYGKFTYSFCTLTAAPRNGHWPVF